MFVPSRNIVILVVTVSKSSVLTVSPVVDFIFFIKNHTEIATCCYSLNVMSFQRFYLGWLGNSFRNVNAMACGTRRVDHEFHEDVKFLPAEAPGIDLSFFTQCNSVSFSSDYIFDLYVMLLEILNNFRLILIFLISMTKFSVGP